MSTEQKTLNTWNKGINQDLAKSVYKEGNILDGLNITFLTDSGLSTVVIQNKKGTKFQVEFPAQIDARTYETTGEYPITVPTQVNFIPLGGIEINDKCFVFTTSNTLNNPNDKGYLQIWRFTFDLTDNIINASNGVLLNDFAHLMYNRYLNISLDNRLKIVGKYENENFARLYWTDNGRNPLRTINTIGALSDIIQTPVRSLNIVAEANLDTPIISKLITGDLPEGKYQIAYRLLSKAGVLTKFSTCSNLIDVIEGDEYNSELDYPRSNTIEYSTDKEATTDTKILVNSQKGIQFSIPRVDNDYQMIQYALIYYSQPNIPEIYVYPYKEISLYTNLNDSLTELYDDTFLLNLDDFNIMYAPFEKVKTLEIKENTLYAANTTNTEFKVDVDYRAYRFNQEGEATTYELDNTTNTFTASNYPTDIKLDVINPYNDDSGKIFGLNPSGTPEDWYIYQQYKYKADGVTPGGQGPNISYTFGATTLVIDTNSNSQSNKPPFIKTEVDTSNLSQSVPNHITNNNGSFSSFKSPYKASCQVSWQRGEVYRIGIVFTNTKGQSSYVNWIGDIKMPDFNEFNNPVSLLSSYSSGKLTMYSTNIEFNVNVPENLAKEISGFRIVYVERKDKDKTRFGTGITGGFEQFIKERVIGFTQKESIAVIVGVSCNILRRVLDNMLDGTTGTLDPFKIKDKLVDKVCEAFATFITQKILPSISNIERLTNPEYLAEMIDSILEGVTNQKSGLLSAIPGFQSTVLKLISSRVIELIRNLLKQELTDIFIKKVAGIHKNVLALGKGFAYSNINSIYGTGNIGYTISPIVDFETYKYRQGDFLRPIQGFHENQKLINEIHRDTSVGIYNPIDSSAYIRKWYEGKNFNWNNVADKNSRRIYIKNQKVLKPAELLGTGFDSLLTYAPGSEELDFIISNSFINRLPKTDASGKLVNSVNFIVDNIQLFDYLKNDLKVSYSPSLVALFMLNFGKGEKVLGIGDKKHLFVSDIELDGDGLTNYSSFNIDDAESNINNISLTSNNDVIRYVDYGGDFTVSYNRSNGLNQYNGIGYSSRANNTYIPASEFYLYITRTANSNCVIKANLGDSYVGAYGAVNYCYYYDQINPEGYQKSIRTKKGLYEIFPCEADFNFTLREGQHIINDLSPDELEENAEFKVDTKKRRLRKLFKKIKEKITRVQVEPAADVLRTKRFLLSDFEFNKVFNQKYNINTFMPPSLLYDNEVDKYTNRIWHSKRKIDGEVVDSWRDFQFVDYIDVEGTQGPIQEIVVNKNKLFFYQTNGIGIASTNERAAVTSDGGQVVLSNGKLLSRYDYITKETGTQHQFSVVNTNKCIYHYDGNLKKLFQLNDKLECISDNLECISDNLGLFSKLNNIPNQVNQQDFTLNGFGVHGIYEPQYQTVYFTFLNANLPDNNFTLSYNEKLQAFESFFSFKPRLYFRLDTKLFSTDDDNCYWHNKGEYGQFYGEYYPSYVKFLTNESPTQTKVWDNQQFQTEVYDNTNTLLNLETINYIQHTTENQDTGVITLIPQTNINKVERDWKVQIQRDLANATYSTLSKPRLRDLYLQTELKFTNKDNKRFILHPITTFYRQSIH
jgi:uncharacterized protein YneR